jgi:hypothetical protein
MTKKKNNIWVNPFDQTFRCKKIKKKNKPSFYFVTLISRKKGTSGNIIRDSSLLLLGYKCRGFFRSLKEARKEIRLDYEFISEDSCSYYLLIEKFKADEIMPLSLFQEWYIVKNNKVIQINQPKEFKHVCNFAMG